MLSYESPDGHQAETVRVILTGRELRATGYLVSTGELVYGAMYTLAADNDGTSRRISVRCDNAEGERSLTLTRSAGGPWLAGGPGGESPMPQLAGATDIYLGGSAFAVSLAVRRFWLQRKTEEVTVTVASVSLPGLAVKAVEHHGRFLSLDDSGGKIAYSGPFGDRLMTVDGDGLLTEVEGLARRLG
jgi:hypothetical protein